MWSLDVLCSHCGGHLKSIAVEDPASLPRSIWRQVERTERCPEPGCRAKPEGFHHTRLSCRVMQPVSSLYVDLEGVPPGEAQEVYFDKTPYWDDVRVYLPVATIRKEE